LSTGARNRSTVMKEILSTGAVRRVLSETGPICASSLGPVTVAVMLGRR
jgi:hypothetical protein